mmetsp:Transcript_12202/g.20725  ORF Transcript_12202/g.20725 Transcript_12202/m.20725 type:complete len:329 (+) Transcript_12202:168-1154(+)
MQLQDEREVRSERAILEAEKEELQWALRTYQRRCEQIAERMRQANELHEGISSVFVVAKALLESEIEQSVITIEMEGRRKEEDDKEEAQFHLSVLEAERLREEEVQQLQDQVIATELSIKECPVCADDISEGQIFRARNCDHVFHWNCAMQHAVAKYEEGCLDIKCPIPECTHPMWSHGDVQYALPEDKWLLYLQRTFNRYASAADNIWQCPTANCGGVWELEGEGITLVNCNVCRGAWCHQCKEQWHADVTCEAFQRWKRENGTEGEAATNLWVQQNARPCSQCKQILQKDGGCNHIVCPICKFHQCWKCGAACPTHAFSCGHTAWS